MKTIVVPTDFSDCSLYGLEFAASLARRTHARLYIINVVTPANFYFAANDFSALPPAAVLLIEAEEKTKKLSAMHLNQLLKQGFLKGIKCQVQILEGNDTHKIIVDYAKDLNADIIIMGTHGASGFRGIFLGSTAERVVRFSDRPVMVIPGKISNMNIRHIVFASDFSRESYSVFPVIKNFAGFFNSKIHLLKVNIMEHFERTVDTTREMRAFNKHFSSNYERTIFDDYSVEGGILNYVNQSQADLIAIGTHGKKGLARFFSRDISEDTLRLTKKPILVVNFNEESHKGDLVYQVDSEEIYL